MKKIEEQRKETTELVAQIKETLEKLMNTFENPQSKTGDKMLDAIKQQSVISDTKIVLLKCVNQLVDNLLELEEAAKKIENEKKSSENFDKKEFFKSEAGISLICALENFDNTEDNDLALINYNFNYCKAMLHALKFFTGTSYKMIRDEKQCGIADEKDFWLFKIR